MILQISAKQISLGMRGDDVARVQQALRSLGRVVPAGEKGVMGAGTVALVKALQEELGLPGTGVVDATTVRLINGKLAKRATDPQVVRGFVLDADGSPFARGFVQLFSQGPVGEQVIGKSALNAADGSYTISYQIPPNHTGRLDLRIAVLDNSGRPIETTPSGASILTSADQLEVVDFVLSGDANPPLTEFELILSDLKPLLEKRDLADLTEDASRRDISMLASRSGYSAEQVASLVTAHKLAKTTKTPPEVFYGLLRQGLPADVLALHATHPDVLLNALKSAVKQGVVPSEVGGKKVENHLSAFVPAPESKLRPLLGRILNPNELNLFVGKFLENSQDPDAFWKKIAADPALANRAAELKRTIQIGALTNNHEPLIGALRSLPEIKEMSDLASLTEKKWKSLVQAQGVGVPADTPGANADEKANTYVKQIVAQVEAAFPARFLAERLPTTPVAAVFKHPEFDLRKTYPGKFFAQNPDAVKTLTPEERNQVEALTRVYRLTGSAEETIALSAKVQSAQQISRMDRKVFAEQNKEIFSAVRANEIHDQALRTNAVALALLSEHGAGMNRTGLQALPKMNTLIQKEQAASQIPDWETLFGTFDLCACQECSSAHGPAAYFVDVLKFLGEREANDELLTPRDVLFARRPDLGDIELSCENTNIVLPLIDLVNESLENAVSPPLRFQRFTLLSTLEADLNEAVATTELSAAFSPVLQSGSRVETLEAEKRWRVWDETFAYTIVKENNVLSVVARSLQTMGTTEERRATPQYRNSDAYKELSKAVYPWTLPFALPREEANIFLEHLGVSRRNLIEALRAQPDAFDANSPVTVLLAAEELGLSDTERKIIVDEPLDPPRQLDEFWDSAPVDVVETVQEMLDRSGLSYVELEELLATWFINPNESIEISAKPDAPVATCDTTKLRIDGLTTGVLSRMHRFVRLWRKLGWTIAEVDKSIRAFVPDSTPPSLSNEVLVRLGHLSALRYQLRISVTQALAFWKPIDTAEPASLYGSLFYNPVVFRPQDEDFRLTSDRSELVHSDKLLADHAAALQAVFRLTSESFALLVKPDDKLTLGNLTVLYRHASVARRLGLSVQDLLTALDLTGINPFGSNQSQDTLRFVEVVRSIRNSGFNFAELDYLIRHQLNPAAPFVPTESTLAQTLTDVRADLIKIEAPSDEEKKKLQESSVIDRVSAALSLPADVTAALLKRVFHGTADALQLFLALSAIPDEALPLSLANTKPQFDTLEKLLKVATILLTLKLPSSQLDWLFRENPWLAVSPDSSNISIPFNQWFSLIQLQQLRQELTLEDAALEAILGAASAVVGADEQSKLAAKAAFVEALSLWLGWAGEDLELLVGKTDSLTSSGLLDAQVPDDYRGLDLIVRLQRAMALVKRLGVTAAQANEWCESSVADKDAKTIRGAAKARHDDAAWLKVAIPLQNSLRDKQREALVTYLVARPAKWKPELARADRNDLYSHFLIDVEMSSCQLTSRIKQAMGSVQLFAQRCLMGLEPGVRTSDGKWEQWEWMKNFRVWEANRKVWLYPENWIEPDLRDNKTPFFKDLENELLEGDLDDAAAEQAVLHYLEKLDEVGSLQIVGAYEDDEDRVLHVFGRTLHEPHIYYYRRRHGTTRSWTPWEKVELDIEGDHLIPVIWNRRLMLIWPIFTEKAREVEVVMPQPGQRMNSAERFWEIQLAWSEYQHDRWSGKNLSEAVRFIAHQGEDNILFGAEVKPPSNAPRVIRMQIDQHPPHRSDDDDPEPPDPEDPVEPPKPTAPRKLVPKGRFMFKAIAADDELLVRGYLSRDYRAAPDTGDSQIGCVFGEFRFFGCRKIVTTANTSQMGDHNFALAPKGTKINRMWFTQTAPGLVMFEGKFPPLSPLVQPVNVLSTINEPASIAGDPASTLVNKVDIPVLDSTPSKFHLLAPHQDLPFVCGRPFFYMDSTRTFIVTSGKQNPLDLKDLTGWLDGNLATVQRVDFFRAPPQAPSTGPINTPGPARQLGSLTVLAPGPGGSRIAKNLVAVDLQPQFFPRTVVPTFWTTREFRFMNFHHPYLCDFEKALNRDGLPGLLSLTVQSSVAERFLDDYRPQPRVLEEYPKDEVEFQSGRAYELYNWELFFHIPLLIADRLRTNQRFQDAQRWFHFIFDPTGASGGDAPQRYWRTKPFNERLRGDYEAEAVKTIEEMAAKGISEELKVAVEIWRSNPFSPHAVARLRTTAYQKTVVMKYIDNLIAWGDQLFRRETLESINEATQLYVKAAEILGRRPEVIQRNVKPAVQTFNSLDLQPGGLGNPLEQIELLIPDAGSGPIGDSSQTPDPPSDTVLYFCVPENDKLLGYWSTVADRLFKIRHCMNIEGQVRQLPLFEPPIDPGLLVRARAAGLSIGDVLSEINGSLPNYRFAVMLQKANEVVSEVRNLGAALLSNLEKRDAEALSTLRSGQELRLLQTVRDVRVNQIAESKANIAGLQASRQMAETRRQYYESRESVSPGEKASRLSLQRSQHAIEAKFIVHALEAVLHKLGNIKMGSPTTAGIEVGSGYMAAGLTASAALLEATASALSIESQLEGRKAEYVRRQEEWDHQANLATIEVKQIDQQLAAAEIRLAIAEQELKNHDQQIENARDVDRFLRDKFTNQDLYQYMVGRVSGLYFQSYQLAYDLARRAEHCMQHELGLQYGGTSFIRFGYWDSLKKGLLAGDHLAYDLKRLEVGYLDGNAREYELTKHVSLVSLEPEQLLILKETGKCEFNIPEWLFDLDTPGHFMRRLKMVSLTIPCVTGPYTSIHCKLQLARNSYRKSADVAPEYDRRTTDDPSDTDNRFIDDRSVVEKIVTSTAQNDAGLFEPNMRDERYLPFEGAGAISAWRLELPTEFKTFDYSTISDVILHMRYTARDGGDELSGAATESAKTLLKEPPADQDSPGLVRLFSLRHEFPSEWHRFVSLPSTTLNTMTVDLATTRFPYFVQGREIKIDKATVFERRSAGPLPKLGVAAPGNALKPLVDSSGFGPDTRLAQHTFAEEGNPGLWTFGTNSDPKLVADVFVVFEYSVSDRVQG